MVKGPLTVILALGFLENLQNLETDVIAPDRSCDAVQNVKGNEASQSKQERGQRKREAKVKRVVKCTPTNTPCGLYHTEGENARRAMKVLLVGFCLGALLCVLQADTAGREWCASFSSVTSQGHLRCCCPTLKLRGGLGMGQEEGPAAPGGELYYSPRHGTPVLT